jgi:hypothetical protein
MEAVRFVFNSMAAAIETRTSEVEEQTERGVSAMRNDIAFLQTVQLKEMAEIRDEVVRLSSNVTGGWMEIKSTMDVSY